MLFCSQVQGRRTQSGQWQYYWSWEWRRNEQQCGDMALEHHCHRGDSRHSSQLLIATPSLNTCHGLMWGLYFRLVTTLRWSPGVSAALSSGHLLAFFLGRLRTFLAGNLAQQLGSLLYSDSVATWSATSSHSTPGRVRHCSSVTRVQFTVSMGVHTSQRDFTVANWRYAFKSSTDISADS